MASSLEVDLSSLLRVWHPFTADCFCKLTNNHQTDPAGTYTCKFDGIIETTASFLSAEAIECKTPRRSIGSSEVTVYFDGALYSPDSVLVEFFDCAPVISTLCSEDCTNQTYCGWCVEGRTCGSQAKCNNLWLPQCLETSLPQAYANLVGGEVIKFITVNQPLKDVVDTDLKCTFGAIDVAATISSTTTNSTITCISPQVDTIADVVFNAFYLNNPLIEDESFAFVGSFIVLFRLAS